MRTLLTWSDRGAAGPRPAHHQPRDQDEGPVARLISQPDLGDYDRAVVLSTPEGAEPAERLLRALRGRIPAVELRVLPVDDPSDHGQLFAALGPALADLPSPSDLDVVLSAGTPQAQTLWVILGTAGLLERGGRTRLLQVIPAAFVPHRHPRAWREVSLDIDGFPEIRGMRAELRRLRAGEAVATAGLIGDSPPMAALKRQIGRVGSAEVPVLVLGETGTGKELVARALHAASGRAAGPFVAESCAALAEGTLASELFGHERGAFTGAAARHRGLFEVAHGGTLFLDEVGELPPRVQAMLLRVLQEGRLRRVGGEATVAVDVRLIAATHRDLPRMVRAGDFREDLYYRLRGAELRLPALRERPGDLEALVARFLAEQRRADLRVEPAVFAALRGYDWPGNVRELRAEVLRWTVFLEGRVRPEDLSAEIRGLQPKAEEGPDLRPLRAQVADVELRAIQAALQASAGSLSGAARALQIDRNTLKKKLRAFGMRPEELGEGD